MPIRAVTFDYWGTLYDEVGDSSAMRERQRHRIARMFFQMAGVESDDTQLEHVMAETSRHAERLWLKENRTMNRSELGQYVAGQMGFRIEEPSAEALGEALAMAGAQVPPSLKVGANGVLEHLHGRYKLGLISDTGLSLGCALREVMRSDQVLDYFDHLTFSDETSTTKPMTRQFHYTCHMLQVPPEHTVHVGDLEQTDITGAREAGLRSVLLTNGRKVDGTAADATIDALEELIDVLEQWEAAE
jgi:putative hydrolase of the HAD superfamily